MEVSESYSPSAPVLIGKLVFLESLPERVVSGNFSPSVHFYDNRGERYGSCIMYN